MEEVQIVQWSSTIRNYNCWIWCLELSIIVYYGYMKEIADSVHSNSKKCWILVNSSFKSKTLFKTVNRRTWNVLNAVISNQKFASHNHIDWTNFWEKAKSIAKHKCQKNRTIQIAKYENSVNQNYPVPMKRQLFKCVEQINDFVRNLSNKTFTHSELDLFNRGFNFAIQPTKSDVLIDFETAMSMCDEEDEKTRMRCEAVNI